MPALSRDEVARSEAGHTTVRPVVAAGLVTIFLGAILSAQAAQWFGAPSAEGPDSTSTARSILTAVGAEIWPDRSIDPRAPASLPVRIVAADRVVLKELRAVDDALDHDSAIGRLLRPATQRVLSDWLGAGNEQVYCGRGGWLFYQPDVEYLTGPGFLHRSRLSRRLEDHDEWASPPQPDPRPAIEEFAAQLALRRITLIVVPTPAKPTIHPERLARAYEGGAVAPQNPSYAAAIADFRSSGALVFDPVAALRAAREESGLPQYLVTDTHWRPESMELVAGELAAFLRRHVGLPPLADPGYRTERQEVSAFGDLRLMLDLPASGRTYPQETVTNRRVLGPDGAPWRPSRSADVLVLGDSFSNIYSLASMGWGGSAGFVEQLSEALRRPLDRIVENDDGAFATRARLRQELAGGVDRLEGKRVVIYQFSARELAFGDWKTLAWPQPRGF